MTRTIAVNCSILLKELSIPERLAAVKDAGFDAVEFWWPFATATPTQEEVDEFVSHIEASGLELIGLNLFAGDMGAGDRGVISWPGREGELRASTEIARQIGERLGTKRFNALYGNRVEGADPAEQDRIGTANLRWAAEHLAAIDAVVLVEPVSGSPDYPLLTGADVLGAIERVEADGGPTNLGLLLDVYHLSVNGDDVEQVIALAGDRIEHVQVADAPGRGYPGSGDLPIESWLRTVRDAGYTGRIALEYAHPEGNPFDHFDSTNWKELA